MAELLTWCLNWHVHGSLEWEANKNHVFCMLFLIIIVSIDQLYHYILNVLSYVLIKNNKNVKIYGNYPKFIYCIDLYFYIRVYHINMVVRYISCIPCT